MDDPRAMARELEGLLKGGGLDPAALIAGDWRFHSCFLAPFSPSFAEARQQFLVDGGGPLSATVEQLRRQGVEAGEAAGVARRMIEQAVGLCVAVVGGDHGVTTVPQPFFGHLAAEWRDGASRVLAEPFRAPFAEALAGLEACAARGWPHAVAGPAMRGDAAAYWLDLAHGAAGAIALAGARGDARLADLGHWVADAIAALAPPLDGDDHAVLCRCRLAAGEFAAAGAHIDAHAAAGGDAAELFDALASACAAAGGDTATAAWLAGPGAALAADQGLAYDAALARIRILAAAGVDGAELAPAVAALLAANRKLARQALTREPIWQVTAADPGELIDTAAAAELLGRSPTAIAKRIEARTMPVHIRDGQIRIPRRALLAWQAAVGPLDG
jgi:hypothetical protein